MDLVVCMVSGLSAVVTAQMSPLNVFLSVSYLIICDSSINFWRREYDNSIDQLLRIAFIGSTVTLRLVTKRERTASYLLAGRVEVLHNGQWGTICNKGFDSIDAQVLCQRLTGSSLVLRYGEVGSYGLQYVN